MVRLCPVIFFLVMVAVLCQGGAPGSRCARCPEERGARREGGRVGSGGLWLSLQAAAPRGPGSRPGLLGTMGLRGGGFLASAWGGQQGNKFGMTDGEKLALRRLREELADELRDVARTCPEMLTDDRLLRFLRSYGHDEARTASRMRDMFAWRREHGADRIRAEVVRCWTEDFWSMSCLPRKDFFQRMYLLEPNHAVTSSGELASVEYTGAITIREFMHGVSSEETMAFWTYLMEWNMIKLAQLSRKHDRIARMVQIKDLHGLSLWQATCKKGMDRFHRINVMLHLVYPETLFKLVVMNVPGVFGVVWRIFRPLMPKRTLGKICIWSGEREVRRGLQGLLGGSDPLTRAGSAAAIFGEVQQGVLGVAAPPRRRILCIAAGSITALALSWRRVGSMPSPEHRASAQNRAG